MKHFTSRLLLFSFFLFFSSCIIERSYDEGKKNEYLLEEAKQLLGKDWHIVGLHCDNENIPGDHGARPFLSFDEMGSGEHYLLDVPIFLSSEWSSEGAIEGNDVGEIILKLYYNNAFGAEYSVKFQIISITEDELILLDKPYTPSQFQQLPSDYNFYTPEEFCWITLEAR
jgi:hypothetical protein